MRLYNSNGLVVVQRTGQEREASPESICLDDQDFASIPYLHVSASIQVLNRPAIDRWLPFSLSLHHDESCHTVCHHPATQEEPHVRLISLKHNRIASCMLAACALSPQLPSDPSGPEQPQPAPSLGCMGFPCSTLVSLDLTGNQLTSLDGLKAMPNIRVLKARRRMSCFQVHGTA